MLVRDVSSSLTGRMRAEFHRRGAMTLASVSEAATPLELRGPSVEESHSRFYLRNISCGVFGGDSYDVSLTAREGARAFVRTTSATKVHAMHDGVAVTKTRLESSPNAMLAYYDGPTILQGASELWQRVEVVPAGGVVIYAEVLVWGRLARHEVLAFRRFNSELVVRDEARRACFVERYDLQPDDCGEHLLSASPPVLGKVIVAGAMTDTALAKLASFAGDPNVGFDELPSGAGYMIRAVGERMDAVAGTVESVILDLFELVR